MVGLVVVVVVKYAVYSVCKINPLKLLKSKIVRNLNTKQIQSMSPIM